MMKRFLSTALTVVLLLGLGALAVLARPGGAERLSSVRTASALAAPVAQGDVGTQETLVDQIVAPKAGAESLAPEAPMTPILRWNNIAIPLDAGVTTADAVAAYINNTNPPTTNNAITRVARWDATSQALVIRNVGSTFGTPNFAVALGDWLLVGANANAPATFAWVGNVPNAGSRTYSLLAGGYNAIMLPLDRGNLTTADALANAIGGITRVAKWNADTQSLVIRNANAAFGTPNFEVKIGYPYLIFSTQTKNWPSAQ